MGLSAGLRNGMLNSALTQQRQMLQEKIKQQEALKAEVKDIKKAFENNDDAFSAFDENNQESSATISTKDIPTETILANSGVTINKSETEETKKTEKPTPGLLNAPKFESLFALSESNLIQKVKEHEKNALDKSTELELKLDKIEAQHLAIENELKLFGF